MKETNAAFRIIQYLIVEGELSREKNPALYSEYLDEKVQEILEEYKLVFHIDLLHVHNKVYHISRVENKVFNVNHQDIKGKIMGKSLKDDYLAYYIILVFINYIYGGKNADPKVTDYVQVSTLIDIVDKRMEIVASYQDEYLRKVESELEINLRTTSEIWISKLASSTNKRKTKEATIKSAMGLLLENKLIKKMTIDESNTFYPTEKLDNLMRRYYLSLTHTEELFRAFEREVI